jgi:DNA-binding LacI/PurR family transcriptional regulator
LVFPTFPSRGSHWSRFWTALSNDVTSTPSSPEKSIRIYHGIDGRDDVEGFIQLSREVYDHTLAGIVFTWPPGSLAETPLVSTPGIPRVAIMAPNAAFSHISSVSLDFAAFRAKALDYLVAQNRKRIAVIGVPGQNTSAVVSDITSRNLETRDHWIQTLPFDSPPECARQLAMLLMHSSQTERPDGLVIMDDNLVEAVTGGLVLAGVNVPNDLDVVGHCNFPWPTDSVLPIKRLGFDAHQVMNACINCLIEVRRTGREAMNKQIAPVFEDELE